MTTPVLRGTATEAVPTVSVAWVRERLLARDEIVLVDLREEAPYAEGHPLWAANMPLSRLELEARRRIPRLDTPVVLYGHHRDQPLAPVAAQRLRRLGYTDVSELEGGIGRWSAAGGELFRDVNVPSKAFGELVAETLGTRSVSPDLLNAWLESDVDVVVLDARPFEEFATMSIPQAVNVPGGELVLRVGDLAPDPATRVVVNCAGRTRSIIGTQSLVNAGVPNQVLALRNGTIGWTLAGFELDHGASARPASTVSAKALGRARTAARALAERADVHALPLAELDLLEEPGRTLYRFDVRGAEEFAAGHLPGFTHVPGGQLVQETDQHAPVRGARILLADNDGVRAALTGSWLAQMGWETWTVTFSDDDVADSPEPAAAAPPAVPEISADELRELLASDPDVRVLDITAHRRHASGHIPGAWWSVRAQLDDALAAIGGAERVVLTCWTGALAAYATADLLAEGVDARLLTGGTVGWIDAGGELETGERNAVVPTDRYRRPYEGTENSAEAMQAYLDWEFGLVAQLGRDGTHNFRVLLDGDTDLFDPAPRKKTP